MTLSKMPDVMKTTQESHLFICGSQFVLPPCNLSHFKIYIQRGGKDLLKGEKENDIEKKCQIKTATITE